MPSTTLQSLLNNVGAKLHVTLGTTTVPTQDQVTQWLNDAQVEIARIKNVPELVISYTPPASTVATSVAAPDNLLRIVDAYDNFDNKKMYPITYDIYTRIKAGSDSYYTTSTYCYLIGNNGTSRVIYYYPESDPGEKTFLYLKKPDDLVNLTDVISISDDYAPFLVDYAVIQGRVQTEDYEKVYMLLADWYKKLGVNYDTKNP